MIVYEILQETLWNSEIGTYTAYAVCAYERQNGNAILLSYTSDVFLNKEDAEAHGKLDSISDGNISFVVFGYFTSSFELLPNFVSFIHWFSPVVVFM